MFNEYPTSRKLPDAIPSAYRFTPRINFGGHYSDDSLDELISGDLLETTTRYIHRPFSDRQLLSSEARKNMKIVNLNNKWITE